MYQGRKSQLPHKLKNRSRRGVSPNNPDGVRISPRFRLAQSTRSSMCSGREHQIFLICFCRYIFSRSTLQRAGDGKSLTTPARAPFHLREYLPTNCVHPTILDLSCDTAGIFLYRRNNTERYAKVTQPHSVLAPRPCLPMPPHGLHALTLGHMPRTGTLAENPCMSYDLYRRRRFGDCWILKWPTCPQ